MNLTRKSVVTYLTEDEKNILVGIKKSLDRMSLADTLRYLIKNYNEPTTKPIKPVPPTKPNSSTPKLQPTPECIKISEALGFEPLKEGNKIYGIKPNGDKVLYRTINDPMDTISIKEEVDITEVYFAWFKEDNLIDIHVKSIIDYNSEVSDLKFSEKPLKVDSDWFVEGNSKNKVWEKD